MGNNKEIEMEWFALRGDLLVVKTTCTRRITPANLSGKRIKGSKHNLHTFVNGQTYPLYRSAGEQESDSPTIVMRDQAVIVCKN